MRRLTFYSLLLPVFHWNLCAYANVEMVRLDPTNLSRYAGQTQSLGVVPGDVALSNPFMKVVLKATVDNSADSVGKAIVWHGLPNHAVQLRPGAGIPWNSAEAGNNGRVAVVRYQHVAGDWQAELIYKLFDNSPWLDVTLTLTNKNASEILEIPAVYQMAVTSKAAVAEQDGQVWIDHKENGPAVSFFPQSGKFSLQQQPREFWWVQPISGDPEPNVLKRFSRNLPLVRRLTSGQPNRPIDPSKDWPRQTRDRSDWFRIEPGQQRTLRWKLVIGADEEHTRSLVRFSQSGKEPQIQLVPANTGELPRTMPAAVPSPALPVVTSRRIVGRLRAETDPADVQVAPPQGTPAIRVTPAPSSGPMLSPPPPATQTIQTTEPMQGPLILPESLLETGGEP